MPRTVEDVENYLLQLDRRFENDGGTLVLSEGAGKAAIAVRVAPPIVAVHVVIGTVPAGAAQQVKFFRRLLEYNATDLMHASYGIEGDRVVLSAALVLDTLDVAELEATLSDVDLALARHVPDLHDLANAS